MLKHFGRVELPQDELSWSQVVARDRLNWSATLRSMEVQRTMVRQRLDVASNDLARSTEIRRRMEAGSLDELRLASRMADEMILTARLTARLEHIDEQIAQHKKAKP